MDEQNNVELFMEQMLRKIMGNNLYEKVYLDHTPDTYEEYKSELKFDNYLKRFMRGYKHE